MEEGLIDEYKILAATCYQTDYSSKPSVRQHNKAVDRMYEIVEAIGYEQTDEEILQFVDLLDCTENNTHLWTAVHILERLPTDRQTEEKAVKIIEKAAQGDSADAMGYRFWLNEYKNRETHANHKK